MTKLRIEAMPRRKEPSYAQKLANAAIACLDYAHSFLRSVKELNPSLWEFYYSNEYHASLDFYPEKLQEYVDSNNVELLRYTADGILEMLIGLYSEYIQLDESRNPSREFIMSEHSEMQTLQQLLQGELS